MITLAVLILGTVIIIKQKISPDELKKMALEYSTQNFPNADVEIGEIKMSLGLKISFVVDKFLIKEKQQGKIVPALRLDGLEVIVPVWSIFMGAGNVEISLIKPDIHIEKAGKSFNLVNVFNKNSPTILNSTHTKLENKSLETNKSISMEVPAFLMDSSINVRIFDAKVDYVIDAHQGKIDIEKIIIKNIGFKNQSAFEINSNFKLDVARDQLQLSAILIGQIEMSKFFTEKKVVIESVLKVENLKLENANRALPDFKMESTVNYFLNGEFSLLYNAQIGNNNKLNGEVLVGPTGMQINKINYHLFLDELIDIFVYQDKLPIHSNGAFIKLGGSVGVNNQGHISNDLEWSTDKNIVADLNGIKISSDIKGSFKGSKILIGISGGLLDGNYSVKARGDFDLNQKKVTLEKMGPFEIIISGDHIKLTEKILSPFTSSPSITEHTKTNKNASAENINSPKNSAKLDSFNIPLLPEATVILSITDSTFDKSSLALNLKAQIKRDSISTEKLNLFLDKGTLAGRVDVNFYKEQIVGDVTADIKSINIDAFRLFMPKIFNQVTGDFTGNFKANLKLLPNSALKYSFSTLSNLKNGEIKGLNLKEFLNDQIGKIPNAEKADNIPVTQNFKILTLNASGEESYIDIKHSHFIGFDEKVEIKSKGRVFMPGSAGNSELFVDLTDNSGVLAKSLEKYAASNTIPLRFKGKEFALMLDYGFTIQKITKLTLQKKGKEFLKEKAPDLINEHLPEKLKENKNVKKLLKKLF